MASAELWVYGSEFLDREQTRQIVHSFPTLPTRVYCHMDLTDELVKEGTLPPTIRWSRPTADSLDALFVDDDKCGGDDKFNALVNLYLYYGTGIPDRWDLKVLLSPHTPIQRAGNFDFYNPWEKELNARGLNRWHHLAAVFYAGISPEIQPGNAESTPSLSDDFLTYGKILVDHLAIPAPERYLVGLKHGQKLIQVHREGVDTLLLKPEYFSNVLLLNHLLRNL